jgi:hypothetical protein
MALHGGNLNLENHAEKLQAFLNVFEDSLEIPHSKIHTTDNPIIVIVEFSKDWTENGPFLSAFTTLIRLGGLYEEGDVLDYLKKIHGYKIPANQPKGFPRYMLVDIQRLDISLPKFAALLEGKRPVHKWGDFKNINYVHDTGIVGFREFPTVEVI